MDSRSAFTECSPFIRTYFEYGMKYTDIVSALYVRHGVSVSLRHLKRILKSLNCSRQRGDSDITEVVSFIGQQLGGSGQLHGYRWMHQKCLLNNLSCSRETVRIICSVLDPSGVQLRRKRRFDRRSYYSKGPNFIWHVDGYDKLKPYGICISACIDGYSRRIMWLNAYKTNNDPRIIAGYFLQTVREHQGCPRTLRGDFGTENVIMRDIQRYFHRDETNGPTCQSYLEGASTANQRIESWWNILRRQCANYWMTTFRSLVDDASFDGSFMDKSLIQFCFMGKIQDELDQVKEVWNSHHIRPSRNANVPFGRPHILFHMPELTNSQTYLHHVTESDIELGFEAATVRPPVPCDQDVFDLCCCIMQNSQWIYPNEISELLALYRNLRHEVLNLLQS